MRLDGTFWGNDVSAVRDGALYQDLRSAVRLRIANADCRSAPTCLLTTGPRASESRPAHQCQSRCLIIYPWATLYPIFTTRLSNGARRAPISAYADWNRKAP